MLKFKTKRKDNFLEYIPLRNENISFRILDNKHVEIDVEHKGVFYLITQKLCKKPKISHIEMEEFGSFIWLAIDGKKNIINIADEVKEKFGDKAEPLYERISKYLRTLYSHKFISFKKVK